jgi:hypothetical protein
LGFREVHASAPFADDGDGPLPGMTSSWLPVSIVDNGRIETFAIAQMRRPTGEWPSKLRADPSAADGVLSCTFEDAGAAPRLFLSAATSCRSS